ncbi:MAG: hypothetical protein RIQ79_1619, partial [Verrucomicrobiota bacterium]
LRITSLGTVADRLGHAVKSVHLLGHDGPPLAWHQTSDALAITCPDTTPFRTALVFRID